MRRLIPAATGLLVALFVHRCFPCPRWAATGLSYLKVGVGARAVAIGNAVVSHVDDASAMGWNPGALPLLTGTEAELMHQESLDGVRNEYAALWPARWVLPRRRASRSRATGRPAQGIRRQRAVPR